MNELCFPLAVQLKGVQEKWARDSQLQPLGLRVGKLVEKLAPLLHDSIFYLNLSDPKYLRGKSMGGVPFLQEQRQLLGAPTEITCCSFSWRRGGPGRTCNQLPLRVFGHP